MWTVTLLQLALQANSGSNNQSCSDPGFKSHCGLTAMTVLCRGVLRSERGGGNPAARIAAGIFKVTYLQHYQSDFCKPQLHNYTCWY